MTLRLSNWIKKHEGYRSKAYRDSMGIITIGWGRNLEDVGISVKEAEFLFQNDLDSAIHELEKYSWYNDQPEKVKWALVNMCFNMGIQRLLGFKRMISALIVKDYTKASIEALDSAWARQVGHRAKDVALMMRGE